MLKRISMRSRNIKPGIFLNEILGQADPIYTILFEGLWCMADKLGRLEDRPLRIKVEIFPYRELTEFNGYLTQLERWGFIHRYSVGSLKVIQVVNFEKHQSPHHTERNSELPAFIDGCEGTVGPPLDNGGNPPDSLIHPFIDSLIPDSPKVPRKRVTKPKEDESIDSILGGKDSEACLAYWKLAGLFGPSKNFAPKTTARLYATAIVGFHPDNIHQKAQELVKATSEQKYLPQLAKWLEGEGYRNPTQTNQLQGVSNGSRSPQHRAAIDAAYLEHLNKREAPANSKGAMDDEGVLDLWENAAKG